MKRKIFLSSVFTGIAAAKSLAIDISIKEEKKLNGTTIIPPYLQPGDTVGITSPAGYITVEEIQSSINKIQEWGYKVKIGDTIGKRAFTFGGTDEERKNDFQQMLNDDSIKAILCARGGYGFVRIVDELDFKYFKKHPKWIIGFSDITVLHSHLNEAVGVASIHSKMSNSFPDDWSKADVSQIETIESIGQCLSGKKMSYAAIFNPSNKAGSGTGELVGGNCKTLESLAGSKSDICTKNKILFVEDTGEYLYSIDRMFWNLKRSGKLSHLKGLIIGGFKVKKDDAGDEFGKTVEEIVLEKIREYNYPVCFDFPVGHQRNNFALKCGMQHQLVVAQNESRLSEL